MRKQIEQWIGDGKTPWEVLLSCGWGREMWQLDKYSQDGIIVAYSDIAGPNQIGEKIVTSRFFYHLERLYGFHRKSSGWAVILTEESFAKDILKILEDWRNNHNIELWDARKILEKILSIDTDSMYNARRLMNGEGELACQFRTHIPYIWKHLLQQNISEELRLRKMCLRAAKGYESNRDLNHTGDPLLWLDWFHNENEVFTYILDQNDPDHISHKIADYFWEKIAKLLMSEDIE